MKCRDCGNKFSEERKRSTRDDVCVPCMETRKDLVSGRLPTTPTQFAAIQKSMANGRGTAARRIDGLTRQV